MDPQKGPNSQGTRSFQALAPGTNTPTASPEVGAVPPPWPRLAVHTVITPMSEAMVQQPTRVCRDGWGSKDPSPWAISKVRHLGNTTKVKQKGSAHRTLVTLDLGLHSGLCAHLLACAHARMHMYIAWYHGQRRWAGCALPFPQSPWEHSPCIPGQDLLSPEVPWEHSLCIPSQAVSSSGTCPGRGGSVQGPHPPSPGSGARKPMDHSQKPQSGPFSPS